jgi:hypothetical protein
MMYVAAAIVLSVGLVSCVPVVLFALTRTGLPSEALDP